MHQESKNYNNAPIVNKLFGKLEVLCRDKLFQGQRGAAVNAQRTIRL
jgi:hypothetical protein